MNVHPKIVGSGLAGAVTIVLMWAVRAFTNVDVPPEVASSVTTILSTAAGYYIPSPPEGQ